MTDGAKRVVVLGGGPGGVAAAIRAAQLGASATLVEPERIGGVCLNRGCLPLRVMGSALEGAGEAARPDPAGLRKKVAETVDYVRLGTEALLTANRVRVVQGRGRLEGGGSVRVGREQIPADLVVLATGAGWQRPGLPGEELPGVVNPDQLLEERERPESILILGGSPWAVELAWIFHRLGSKVGLVVEGPFLPEIDRQVANRLKNIFNRAGLKTLDKAKPERITASKEGLSLRVEIKGKPETLTAARIVPTHRIPGLEGLGLSSAGVETRAGAVRVDQGFRTTNPRVLAVGDLVGEPLLSHKASAQGEAAVEAGLGLRPRPDLPPVPRVLYTRPEAAGVGLTEKEARAGGEEVVCGEIPYGVNARAAAEGVAEGFVKIVCGARHKEVLGVHLLGPQSAELITQAALALKLEATAEELARLIVPHPSFAEALVDAARMVLGRAMYVPPQGG